LALRPDFLNGRFANLEGYHVGEDFTVQSLAGRDARGAPRWEISCNRCSQTQFITHARLAALVGMHGQRSLQCSNPQCSLACHSSSNSVTLAELRRQERQEAEEAAQSKERVEEMAAKQREKAARIEAERLRYNRYYVHQLKTAAPIGALATFERWQQLPVSARDYILGRIVEDPKVWFNNLNE